MATHLAGPSPPLCLTLAEVGGEEASHAPARLGTGGSGKLIGGGAEAQPPPPPPPPISRLLELGQSQTLGSRLRCLRPRGSHRAWPKSSRGPARRPSSANLGVPDGTPDVKDKSHPGRRSHPAVHPGPQPAHPVRFLLSFPSSTMVAAGGGRTGSRMEAQMTEGPR